MPNASSRGFARALQSKQRLVHVINAKVKGTGTAAVQLGSHELSMTDNGTGDWTLTLVQPGRQLLSVLMNPISDAGDVAMSLHSDTSASLIRVKAWDGTDGTTAKDVDFYLQVTVSDAADEM